MKMVFYCNNDLCVVKTKWIESSIVASIYIDLLQGYKIDYLAFNICAHRTEKIEKKFRTKMVFGRFKKSHTEMVSG